MKNRKNKDKEFIKNNYVLPIFVATVSGFIFLALDKLAFVTENEKTLTINWMGLFFAIDLIVIFWVVGYFFLTKLNQKPKN